MYNNDGGRGGGSSSSTSSSLMSGNGSASTTSSGIENLSSIRHAAGDNDQSKSIEQPVLPKSISQIGGRISFAFFLITFFSKYKNRCFHVLPFIVIDMYITIYLQHPIRIQVVFGARILITTTRIISQ